jgi:hypothetical protein
MRVTIAQGRLVNDQVFEGIKNVLQGTIITKGKRIKPVLTFNFIENDEHNFEELIDEELDYILKKKRLEEEVEINSNGKPFDHFFDSIRLLRSLNNISNDDLIVLVTGERNNRNFLGFTDDTLLNTFIYANEWNRIYSTRINSIYPISFEIFSWIIRSKMFKSVTDLYESSHTNNQGCIMDFCEHIKDHKFKSRTADICETCNVILERNLFPEDIKQYILKSLDIIRQQMLNRDIENREAKSIELKYVNGVLEFVVPSFNDLVIKFSPQAKAVFHFFLQNPDGVSYKSVIDFRQDLYRLYRRFTNREGDQIEIEIINRMLGFDQGEIYNGKNNLSGAINLINETLKVIFNPHIIDNYLLKKSKERYSISLNRDLFIDRTIV